MGMVLICLNHKWSSITEYIKAIPIPSLSLKLLKRSDFWMKIFPHFLEFSLEFFLRLWKKMGMENLMWKTHGEDLGRWGFIRNQNSQVIPNIFFSKKNRSKNKWETLYYSLILIKIRIVSVTINLLFFNFLFLFQYIKNEKILPFLIPFVH